MKIFHTTEDCPVKGIGVVISEHLRGGKTTDGKLFDIMEVEVKFVAVDKHENLIAFRRTKKGTHILNRASILPWDPEASEYLMLRRPKDDARDPYEDAPDFPFATLELPIEIAAAGEED